MSHYYLIFKFSNTGLYQCNEWNVLFNTENFKRRTNKVSFQYAKISRSIQTDFDEMKLFLFITLFAAFTFKNLVICARYDDQEIHVIKYLQSFGYLPEDKNTTSISHKQLKHGLKRLQVRKSIFSFLLISCKWKKSFTVDWANSSDWQNRWANFKVDEATAMRCARRYAWP